MRYVTAVLVKIHFLSDCSSCQPAVHCSVEAILVKLCAGWQKVFHFVGT